ncbi:hypothetical protein PV327_000536 [Microctonus hyperodae]|uniref:IFT81 calponin homology domain-containing protein n=1 Tax=Microctonus hyperodae TaxID=165561 RepID=A0AA39G6H2_MICHY|nr:hypothetical protein PV327_000536 [Microctonus hyperodae]
MTEDLKFIVTELNKIFKKNYTLISFKALNSLDLLQVFSDLLSVITESPKIDLRDEDLEHTALRILSILRVLKYQPNKDPALFRQKLIKEDPETIYSILQWLLSNMKVVQQRAYLARFLVKIEIPPEYLEDPETSAIYERYIKLIEDFKMVHKEREAGRQGGEAAAELKSDLKAMEKEREVITDRIEKVKTRTEAHSHLLEYAQALRLERDRDHELTLQRSQEKEAIDSLQVSVQRADQKLQSLRQAGVELTPQMLQQRLLEEVMILTAICNERLPAELSNLNIKVEALNSIVKSSYIGPDEIVKLRQRLDVIVREVQALAETKVTVIGADKMAPFRQQSAAIAGVKRNMLERLEKTESDLTDITAKLQEKREKTKRFIEDSVPKGDDLKRYVARLKTKSAIYKRCRSDLASLRAECGVVNRTIALLDTKLNKIKSVDATSTKYEINIPENYTQNNAAVINSQLSRNISGLRSKLSSLLNDIQPLRETAHDLEERYEFSRRSYDSVESTTRNALTKLTNEVDSLQEQVNKDTKEIMDLKEKIAKLKLSQEKIQHEMRFYASPSGGQSLRDKLNDSISSEEKKSKALKDEEKEIRESSNINENQTNQWNNLIMIFNAKLEHSDEIKRRDGIVLRGGGAETLILQ